MVPTLQLEEVEVQPGEGESRITFSVMHDDSLCWTEVVKDLEFSAE